MSLRLTNAADYAILAMIHMACRPDDVVALRREVARECEVPSSFMAKILRALVHAGLLRSTRGVRGGFRLARAASEITILDVIEAIDGPIRLTSCSSGCPTCPRAADCPAHPVWVRVERQIGATLREHTLESLVQTPRRNGRVALGA